MNIKVLPLKPWMKNQTALEFCIKDNGIQKLTKTIFGRPGIYLHGVKCWFETANGSAYTYAIGKFIQDLKLLETDSINQRQFNALKGIVEQKLSTPKQRELYYYCQLATDLRKVERNVRKHTLKTIGKGKLNDHYSRNHSQWCC